MSDRDRYDGGEAFPRPYSAEPTGWDRDPEDKCAQRGMTLRDWFAGCYLQNAGAFTEQATDTHFTARARAAYKMADEMLKERLR